MRVVATFVVAAALAAGVATLTSTSGAGARAGGATTTPTEVTSVPAAEAASFAILRRPRTAGDAFRSLHAGAGLDGANPALARTVREPVGGLSAGFVSVVPAAGGVCLRIPHVPYPQDGVMWWCQRTAVAASGRLVVALLPPGPHPQTRGEQLIIGLAPDGVSSANVTTARGARVRAAVRSNVYEIAVRAPRTIAFTLPGGRAASLRAP